MPTKHIDDATAAELDDLYVRCVTLTQQPAKEVEVLRLAIRKGINNIVDDDILSSMSVKSAVWQTLAYQLWEEVLNLWPEDAITGDKFDELVQGRSAIWQQYPSQICRDALRAQLVNEFIEPLYISTHPLFPLESYCATDDERRAAAEERRKLDAEYQAALSALNSRIYASLTPQERALTQYYADRVSFEPIGEGDFTVLIKEPAGDKPSENAAH